jgi:acyl-CoA synthetase (AMP-forming)/AMP-acid ligase II
MLNKRFMQTYGPFTRNYRQPSWESLTIDERAKLMARQGHAFATSLEARVVFQDGGDDLKDVPRDGKTVGEIVTRGNIVMKEVSLSSENLEVIPNESTSTSKTRRRPRRQLGEDTSVQAILR